MPWEIAKPDRPVKVTSLWLLSGQLLYLLAHLKPSDSSSLPNYLSPSSIKIGFLQQNKSSVPLLTDSHGQTYFQCEYEAAARTPSSLTFCLLISIAFKSIFQEYCSPRLGWMQHTSPPASAPALPTSGRVRVAQGHVYNAAIIHFLPRRIHTYSLFAQRTAF